MSPGFFELSSKPSIRKIASGIFCLIPWAMLFGIMLSLPVMITDDSTEYLAFAEGILQRNLDLIQGTAIFRTPGYPSILALGEIVFGNIRENLVYLHLMVAFTLCGLSVWLLKNLIPFWISVGAFGWYLLFNAPFSMAVLTEWSVGCIIVLIYSLICNFLTAPSLKIHGFICAAVSIIVLFRPPMMILGIVPLTLLFYLPKCNRRYAYFSLGIAAILPSIWAYYNFERHEVFALSPRSGTVRLAQLGLLEDAHIECGNICKTEDQTRFVDSFIVQKKTPRDFILKDRSIERAYNHNYGLLLGLESEIGWSIKESDSFTAQLGEKILLNNAPNYLKFISSEFLSQVSVLSFEYQVGFLFLILLLVAGLKVGRIKLRDPIVVTFLGAIIVHLIHMASCVAVVHMLPRFFLLTFLPVVYMLILCLGFSYTKKGSLSAAL